MATVSRLTVSHATQLDAANWATPWVIYGPQEIASSYPREDCIVEAVTAPANSPAEWSKLNWSGGQPVAGKPNQRLVSRLQTGATTVAASIGGGGKQITLWVFWAYISVLTKGPRPKRAKPWTEGAMFTGPDECGAFVVGSFSMGENARGQVVAVAELAPKGVGKAISAAGKQLLLKFRRQLTAHDFVDGKPAVHKKSWKDWVADDSQPGLLELDPMTDDRLFDTDGPDLPTATRTAETYNNFRQWVEWDGVPCSGYGRWYFQARWKDQKVTLKDVGRGSIPLPAHPHYK
jgi:hypothetical protein